MDFPDSLLPFVGLLDYILYPYKAAFGNFLLVSQHWDIHMKGPIGEYYLWVNPYFSSSVQHALFVCKYISQTIFTNRSAHEAI